MDWNIDRRAVIGGMGALAAAGMAGPARAARERPLNVLMIVTDQEQGVASYPAGLLERLQRSQQRTAVPQLAVVAEPQAFRRNPLRPSLSCPC